MKTLLFLRHGKSDWDAGHAHDAERPIKKRGRKDARRVGRFLARTDQLPGLILCSPALRARQTLEHAGLGGGWPEIDIRVTDALYEAVPEALLAEIRAAPDDVDVLMLVGHEPAWSETVGRLVGGAQVRMPTAAVARVDVDAARWQDAAFGRGTLAWLLPPRLLRRS